MASPDVHVRMVRCPRCHSLLQEPTGVPAYQCGGCGATLRVKTSPTSSRSGSAVPPQTQSRLQIGPGDVASTSSSRSNTPRAVPDARRSSERQAAATTSRAEAGDDLVSVRKHHAASSSDVASTPDVLSASKRVSDATGNRRRDPITDRGAPYDEDFEFPSWQRDTTDTCASERNAVSPGVSVSLPSGTEDASRTSESKQAESPPDDAATTHEHSGEAEAQPRFRSRQEFEPRSAESQPSRDAAAAAAGGGGKVSSSPPRHEEDLAPLRQKILKTVDALKGDLSELFSKSPDLNPTKRLRPPRRLPVPNQQQGYASPRGAKASSALPPRSARARHAAATAVTNHRGRRQAGRHSQHGAAPPRGLPSRRYRRCRADPCRDTVRQQPGPCHHHHGCCCDHHHGKPECSSCRGHCGRPNRAREPSSAANKEAARRRPPPPRYHCRPVLKGAPFIVCSTCFTLVQVPADFAVSTNRMRRLRCGACSAVLSYSYRDPARKKLQDDQVSTDGSDQVHGGARPDPFAPFVDDFGLSSYSTTEDEQPQPLHVSRNTSFDTVDAVKGGADRLHRLMGYGSASDLLLRRSPDLYESFDKRTTTPDSGFYDDRKGKAVCVDAEDGHSFDDSDDDDDDSGVFKRTAARGAVWPLPGMLRRAAHGQGAIKIK